MTQNGAVTSQDVLGFFTLLHDLGVNELDMAGEFRGACVSQVKYSFDGKGFAMVDSGMIYPPVKP
ncbi:hypothetical protein HY947_00795 [Candidatus Gottesmanbacteria bacterium]|nr:hypothetical protein [Candidatus Gottesmanbacteria bacterium]